MNKLLRRFADLFRPAPRRYRAPTLREAVEEVVRVIEAAPPSICDTIWVSGDRPETLLDYCLAALEADPPPRSEREATYWRALGLRYESTLDEARAYARHMARMLHARRSSVDAPAFEPADDLMGLLTQIEGMVADRG